MNILIATTLGALSANCTAVVVHHPDGNTSRIDPKQGGRTTLRL